mgnify:CR=1 FL=1
MALKLIANYSKRLGLPGYSSHQFSVSVERELVDVADVQAESEKLYRQLQEAVDRELEHTGFVPGEDYGQGSAHGPASAPRRNGDVPWQCSDKQKEFILGIVEEHELDRHEVDRLAQERFGKGVKQLDKLEASGLIDELLERHGSGKRGGSSGRGRGNGAYARGRSR